VDYSRNVRRTPLTLTDERDEIFLLFPLSSRPAKIFERKKIGRREEVCNIFRPNYRKS
jgi:hypothetical protein